jgi:malate synthase
MQDASIPTWANLVEGQLNLRAASSAPSISSRPGQVPVARRDVATIVDRRCDWHRPKNDIVVHGAPWPDGLVDFGFYYSPSTRSSRQGPYPYLLDLETRLEARPSNDVLIRAQERLSTQAGTFAPQSEARPTRRPSR